MAHTSERTIVAGRTVKIANGIYQEGIHGVSQTINIYDQTNTEGNYQQVYRITGQQHFVTVQDVTNNVLTLQELDAFLVQRGAVREGPRPRQLH